MHAGFVQDLAHFVQLDILRLQQGVFAYETEDIENNITIVMKRYFFMIVFFNCLIKKIMGTCLCSPFVNQLLNFRRVPVIFGIIRNDTDVGTKQRCRLRYFW
jgi:hypothetical protein